MRLVCALFRAHEMHSLLGATSSKGTGTGCMLCHLMSYLKVLLFNHHFKKGKLRLTIDGSDDDGPGPSAGQQA